MKTYIYTLVLSIGVVFTSFGQGEPNNIDYGIFAPGSNGFTPPGNASMQFDFRPNILFPSTPTAADLILFLRIPTALVDGGEVYSITDDNFPDGNMAPVPPPDGIFTYLTDTYIVFNYNGATGINLNAYPADVWSHGFTIYIQNLNPGTELEDFAISDASSPLWAIPPPGNVRTLLNVIGFNEFFPDAIAETLPLELISFDAEKYQDKSAKLDWVTVNEINTSNFVVQRSYDKKFWSNIGSVKAAGMSLNVENYSFVDVNVYNGIDKRLNVYYRLTMVDLDGRSKLSPIQTVTFGTDVSKGREFLVYPNPASDGLQVEWDANRDDQPTTLEFFDISGKLVYSQDVGKNTNQEYIDFGHTTIQPGLYLLRILNGDEPLDHKQIVVGRD